MRFWTTVIIVATFVVSAIAQDREPDADRVRLVTTGEIRKIDSKHKTFEFKITMEAPARSAPVNRPQNGRGGGGGMGGRGGRRGGIGFPGGGSGGRPNPQQAGPTSLEIRVFTSENTLLKDTGNSINFSTFKVGQRVAVTGIHTTKGKPNDVEALEVDRAFD